MRVPSVRSKPYLLALGLVGAAALARFALDPVLHGRHRLFVFFGGIVLAALYGRLKAGVAATVLSVPASEYLFVKPRNSWSFADPSSEVVGLFLFTMLGFALSILIEKFHQTREQLRDTAREQKENEQRLRILADTVPEILYTTTANGVVEYLSPRFSEYTGLGTAFGREGLLQVVHPEDRESAELAWSRAIATGVEAQGTCRLRGADGQYRWFKGHMKPVHASDGCIERWSGVITDIHDQKLLEEALAHQNDEFQKFAYRVCHDLTEPLRTVTVFAEMLVKLNQDRADDEPRRCSRYIADGMERIEGQMRKLLEYAKSGSIEIKDELVDLNRTVEQCIADLHPAIAESGASVICDSLPSVEVNADRIGSVFQNLIGNALKYRGKLAPRIHISAQMHDPDWVFCVEDNGAGFEAQEAQRIFEPFERAASSSGVPGSGLGLAIVKRIIEHKGGRIWAESEPGRGSKFFFTLPRELERIGPRRANSSDAALSTAARSLSA